MTEQDYIKATNRVKVSAALTILRDVLPGDDYGVSDMLMKGIIVELTGIEMDLFASFELTD